MLFLFSVLFPVLFHVLFLVRPSNAFSDYPEACQVGRAIFCFSTATFGIIHHNPVFYVLAFISFIFHLKTIRFTKVNP